MAELDGRGHDRDRARLGLRDERAVDLQLIERQHGQLRERGVAGAEVIHREAHAGDAQQLHVARRGARIAHHGALGDLQDERARFDALGAQQPQDRIAQVRIEDVGCGQVDRELKVQAHAAPGAQLAQRRRQHPVGQRPRAAGALGERHEFRRRDGAELRVRPAHQRLEALHRARRHVDLGLVDEAERVLIDGGAQLGDQQQPAAVLALLADAVYAGAGARLVRLLERHLRALQQLIRAAAVRRVQTHAADHAQLEADAGAVEAAADRRRQLLGVQQRPLGGAVARDRQELGLADARDGVGGGDVLLQAPRDLAQHLIAHLMTEGGVDVGQVAQLHEDQGAGAFGDGVGECGRACAAPPGGSAAASAGRARPGR